LSPAISARDWRRFEGIGNPYLVICGDGSGSGRSHCEVALEDGKTHKDQLLDWRQ